MGATGPQGAQGPAGPNGASVTVYVATAGQTSISPSTEAQATTMINKTLSLGGTYLARMDAELSTLYSLFYDYNCKLQWLTYPSIIGTPYSDVPGTRRFVSWRVGQDENEWGHGSGVSMSMQAPIVAGTMGVSVRMVCWGTTEAGAPIVDYGLGLTAATLTLVPVGSVQ